MQRSKLLILAAVFALLCACPSFAQKPRPSAKQSTEKIAEGTTDKAEEKSKDEKAKDEKAKEEKKPEEKIVQTKHTIKIGGQEIKYTATAGTILLKLEDGTPKASVFYIASVSYTHLTLPTILRV